MKDGFKVWDVDLHLEEPHDLWERKLPEPFRSKTKITPHSDGHLAVGHRLFEVGGLRYGREPSAPTSLVERQGYRRWQEDPHLAVARENCSPEVYKEGMEMGGVDFCTLMPTIAFQLIAHDELDPQHALALCQVYNDYAHEFAASDPQRFSFAGWLPPHDARLAAQEARRCVTELGAVGVAILQGAFNDNLLCDEFFDPLWEEINDLGVPLGIHVRGNVALRDDIRRRYYGHPRAEGVSSTVSHAWYAQTSLAELVFGGVFERYPKLRVIIQESTTSWLPWLLWKMDETWEKYGPDLNVPLPSRPSDYVRRQCYLEVDADETPLKYVIDSFGDDNLLFTTDYPHHDATWPHSVSMLLALEGVSEESKRKILWDNAVKAFSTAKVASAR